MTENDKRLESANERARARVDKFATRQAEIADAALVTLADLGYARTSLREIAGNADFSHAVLRYYFADKMDLILQCIKQYKAVCVKRYDAVTELAETQEDLLEGFLKQLSETLMTESHLHRLWYDLRSQAMFEDALAEDVRKIDSDLENMVWKIVERYAALGNGSPKLSSKAYYALFDGLFQNALARVIAGEKDAILEINSELRQSLTATV
ncbi:MAG: TetR/AcrR family transcriptional regulator [Geminicoccales bacterium]